MKNLALDRKLDSQPHENVVHREIPLDTCESYEPRANTQLPIFHLEHPSAELFPGCRLKNFTENFNPVREFTGVTGKHSRHMTAAIKSKNYLPKEDVKMYVSFQFHLGNELMRVRVSVVLQGELRCDGGHVNADVCILDAIASGQLVHDTLGLQTNHRASRGKNRNTHTRQIQVMIIALGEWTISGWMLAKLHVFSNSGHEGHYPVARLNLG